METVFRVIIVYLVILVGLRIVGKREFGQLSAAELVTLLIIPEMVSQSLSREDSSLTNAIIATLTLLSLVFITSTILHQNDKLEAVVSGKPIVIVTHGKLLEDNMNRERVSPEEIMTALHMSGLERMDEVKWGILEADGKIAIIAEDWVRVPPKTKDLPNPTAG
jgi:uncharacterized membrane protein YcaP (DUF421 family)